MKRCYEKDMKKKLITIIVCCLFLFGLTACGEQSQNINVSNSENLSSNHFGEFVDITYNLAYDSATRIVYIANYTSYNYYVYAPYYAPNGFPYKYNPETNTFEEIEN